MLTVLVAIFVFGLLVFFHELGHFGVAKLVGIKVHEFAIGMGPKLVGFGKGETQYTLRAFPIGGFVRMEGEDEISNDARSFGNKSVLARLAVIIAGPIMNFILALLLFTILFYSIGAPSTTLQGVIPGTPAEAAGLMQGDRVIAIDGEEILDWNQLIQIVSNSKDQALEFTLKRNNETIIKTITPEVDEETKQVMVGIIPKARKSIISAVKSSFTNMLYVIAEIGDFLRRLVARQVTSGEVAGPVGIINMVGQATRAGWMNVVFLAGLISVNLGLMNLLPIPALDGSRIIFLIFEMFRGKPVNPEREGMIHIVGFALLITLMLFITYQDILKLIR